MARLKTLRSPLQGLSPRLQGLPQTAEKRVVKGRHLQSRRYAKWLACEAVCAMCGCTVAYPNGFDLDHTLPLYKGGTDTDENTQVLCNAPNGGCHAIKTRADAATP